MVVALCSMPGRHTPHFAPPRRQPGPARRADSRTNSVVKHIKYRLVLTLSRLLPSPPLAGARGKDFGSCDACGYGPQRSARRRAGIVGQVRKLRAKERWGGPQCDPLSVRWHSGLRPREAFPRMPVPALSVRNRRRCTVCLPLWRERLGRKRISCARAFLDASASIMNISLCCPTGLRAGRRSPVSRPCAFSGVYCICG